MGQDNVRLTLEETDSDPNHRLASVPMAEQLRPCKRLVPYRALANGACRLLDKGRFNLHLQQLDLFHHKYAVITVGRSSTTAKYRT